MLQIFGILLYHINLQKSIQIIQKILTFYVNFGMINI